SNGILINNKNTERKEHDSSITEQALAMIERDSSMISRKTTVVYDESWHKGVIGIVASRLIEKYYRPTVVLTHSNGHVAGSARSVAGFDLYQALHSCSDLLDQFGGHKYAAGLTMKTENIAAFQQRFEEVVSGSIPDDLLIQQIPIDATIPLSHITPKFLRILNQFAPFGPQNMAPIFRSQNVRVYGQATVVGGKHLKLTIRQDNNTLFECIAFGLGDYAGLVNTGLPFDVCYAIEENCWKERRTLQLNIKGIRAETV
ncbi:MAG TPA: DHHA1 domain-containing protein, partial [Sphingobacteriaceae bacterium]